MECNSMTIITVMQGTSMTTITIIQNDGDDVLDNYFAVMLVGGHAYGLLVLQQNQR